MNIGSIIQQHYYRESTLFIPVPIAFVHNTFATLSTTGIVHGTLLNPFNNYYKFNVRWDGNTAQLDGPSGSKLTRLITKIVLHPSLIGGASAVSDRNHTTLKMSSLIPIKDINRNLIFMLLVYAYVFYLIPNPLFKLISLLVYWAYMYGLTWLSVASSIKIICEYLPREFVTIDRD